MNAAALQPLTADDLAERFTEAHRRVYFHGGEAGRQVEIVGLRFGVCRRLDALPVFHERKMTIDQPPGVTVHANNGTVSAHLVQAAHLDPQTVLTGPALIEGYSSST